MTTTNGTKQTEKQMKNNMHKQTAVEECHKPLFD